MRSPKKRVVQCYRDPKAMLLLQQSYCCRLVSRQPADSFSRVPEQQWLPSSCVTEHQIEGCVACGVGGPYGSHAGLVCLMQLLGEVATVHTDVKIVMKSTILE